MIARVIEFSARNALLILLLIVAVIGGGYGLSITRRSTRFPTSRMCR
jgi:hypothetical protein